MTYDPKFPYRINGDPVNASSVGITFPVGDEVLEATCTPEGLVLQLPDREALLTAGDLKWILHGNIEIGRTSD